jgi:hypothetical protein
MNDIERLEADFNKDMFGILERDHSPRFRQMVEAKGGLQAARELLQPDRQLPKDTFTTLRKTNKLDLTVEHYVVQEKDAPLFTPEQREIAQWRLANEG